MNSSLEHPDAFVDFHTGDTWKIADFLHDFRRRLILGDPTCGWPASEADVANMDVYVLVPEPLAGPVFSLWRWWGPEDHHRARVWKGAPGRVPDMDLLRRMVESRPKDADDFMRQVAEVKAAAKREAIKRVEEAHELVTDMARYVR